MRRLANTKYRAKKITHKTITLDSPLPFDNALILNYQEQKHRMIDELMYADMC